MYYSFLSSEGYSTISGSQDCVHEENGSFESLQRYDFYKEPISSNNPTYHINEDSSEIPDFPDACLKFMNDILMEEEDLDDNISTLQDFHALQATEKSFYDVLGETYPMHSSDSWPPSMNQTPKSLDFDDFDPTHFGSSQAHKRESNDYQDERSSKQVAICTNNEEYEEMVKFDDVLISKEGNDDISPCTRKITVKEEGENLHQGKNPKGSKVKKKSLRGKNKMDKEVVDLRTLLIQCAEASVSCEFITANKVLKKIRQHGTPYGDSVQRLAHYFANGLEARMSGNGSDLYRASDWHRISSHDSLKAYKSYVSAVPLTRTSHFLTNQTIAKLGEKSSTIHIIDFGINLGVQWPCFIQTLSRRSLGPPRLKITGVDFPKSGFKPAQIVEETGRRLAGYCQRFGVPFEFKAIAENWHTLDPEEFNIRKDELVVFTCLFNGIKIPDETVDSNSPRDMFLRLIRNLNPDLFISGVINGTYNAPFFINRFREALYHYSCLFDVNEATMLCEDHDRLIIESYVYGKEIMNIVACEGSERVCRPEAYKQWHLRHHRAGFVAMEFDQEILNRARAMVRANYHKDFMVERDKHWMVQGWKGRILSAVSCWKPA